MKSPNPAFANVDVPLVSTFMLSTKPGKEAYVEPVILGARASSPRDADETSALPGYRFTVKIGKPPAWAKNGTKLARGANFRCLMSGAPIASDYIKAEGRAGRMGARLMAIVAEGDRGRVYLPPTLEHEAAALEAKPEWKPETPLAPDPRALWTPPYGLTTFGDLFTPRQLVALTTFSDLVGEAMARVKADYLGAWASRPRTMGAQASHEAWASHPRATWHSRGRLPHFEAGETPQSITFRLHDSLPRELLDRWKDELARLPDDERSLERRKRIEAALDAGQGACWLRDPRVAEVVENALLHFDGDRYDLHAWCVMPNHVHVLVTPLHGNSLSSLVHSWKSFTAKEANRLLGRAGAFWLEEYFDRAIRDENHFRRALEYIENNPVKAGLCKRAGEWRFGSAWERPWERRLPTRQGSPWESGLPARDETGPGGPWEGGLPARQKTTTRPGRPRSQAPPAPAGRPSSMR